MQPTSHSSDSFQIPLLSLLLPAESGSRVEACPEYTLFSRADLSRERCEGRDQYYINCEWFLGHTTPTDLDQLRSVVGLLAAGSDPGETRLCADDTIFSSQVTKYSRYMAGWYADLQVP